MHATEPDDTGDGTTGGRLADWGSCPVCGAPLHPSMSGRTIQCSTNRRRRDGRRWVLVDGCGMWMPSGVAGTRLDPDQANALAAGGIVHIGHAAWRLIAGRHGTYRIVPATGGDAPRPHGDPEPIGRIIAEHRGEIVAGPGRADGPDAPAAAVPPQAAGARHRGRDRHGLGERDRRLLRMFGMTPEQAARAAEQAEDEHTPDPLTGRIHDGLHLTQHRGEAATNPDDPQDLKD